MTRAARPLDGLVPSPEAEGTAASASLNYSELSAMPRHNPLLGDGRDRELIEGQVERHFSALDMR